MAILSWIGSREAVAESNTASSKRAFAAVLARKAKIAAAKAERQASEHASRERLARAAPAPSPTPVARAALIKPVASSSVYGVSAATSVVPPSGYGSGRDAYVEALYPQILARAATQSDVDYWARVLASGTRASTVAEAIWNSQEHKTLERSGQAPDIPLGVAYRRAYAWGLLHCKEREAAQNRRHENN
jgi:hypothetical protein